MGYVMVIWDTLQEISRIPQHLGKLGKSSTQNGTFQWGYLLVPRRVMKIYRGKK